MEKSIEFLNNLNIDKNKYLVVATSGGPDSMTLLHLLKNNNYNIICAHVNHNLRSISDEEYIFVENYCKENNIIFEGMKIEGYKNNKFTEFEAREKRYCFFDTILKKYNTDILLTAHHGDDLIETILMRIIRGSNLSGYKGFTKISNYKNFKIIRPLIFYTKKDIENYINENNIPCVYDESNKSKKYTRNRIRLDILPLLKEEDKNIHQKFLLLNEELEETNNYIMNVVRKNLEENYKNNTLDLIKFNKLEKFIQKKEIEEILYNIYKDDITLVNKKHINSILNLININDNKSIDLPNNIKVYKEYNNLLFKENINKEKNKYNYRFIDKIIIDDFGIIETINDTDEKSNYVIKLNSKEIKLPLIVRTRLDSDIIEVKNMNGKKKINKIFIDEKIKNELRDLWPIVTDSDNNILWIPGIKKSKFDCYNRGFYDIIIKYTKKGDNYEEK
ncbi:MAG: tRNA lysidine(34) synthetase TilS [Bacilli bacterium]|nr:tRNA lysidine(34) synthetase TilS [Bacilli bacterium]